VLKVNSVKFKKLRAAPSVNGFIAATPNISAINIPVIIDLIKADGSISDKKLLICLYT
jgi:hypothetical protein